MHYLWTHPMLQCVCNVHIPVVHTHVHFCCALSRVACLCAVWFRLHVGGDLVLRGLLILFCVRVFWLCFWFCLFAGLNLFKLPWFVDAIKSVLFCKPLVPVCLKNFNQYKHSTMNTNWAEDIFILWWPIWFQVEREQCAHYAAAWGSRQGASRHSFADPVACRSWWTSSTTVPFLSLYYHLVQFLVWIWICNLFHLGPFVWTSCTCVHWLSCCIYFLLSLWNCCADLDVPLLSRKILLQICNWHFAVLPGVLFVF